MSIPSNINLSNIPSHIAVIMDGNGRWAKQKGKNRIFGHENGVIAVRDTTESCAELGVKYLTLYAFSTENWNRPKYEVNALMRLLIATIAKETKTLLENNIQLNAIGDLASLPKDCRSQLSEAIASTSKNDGMTLNLALSYSSRWELVEAMKNIATKVENGELEAKNIDESTINKHLSTHNIPDPELLIRTSGEFRISNFLLWQIAYTELYFTNKLWPDFRREDVYEAIVDFQKRERRFGMISEQMNNQK